MGIDRSDDSDDPTPPPESDPPKAADRSGDADHAQEADPPKEVPSSADVGRAADQTPGDSSRESPEGIPDTQAEPRTRDEYADHHAPPNSPPIEEDSHKPETEEPSHPRDEFPEMTLHEEDRLGEPPTSKQYESERPQTPDNTALSAHPSAMKDDVHKGVPNRDDSTTDGIEEIPDGATGLGGHSAEESAADLEGITSGNGHAPLEPDSSDAKPSNDPLVHDTGTGTGNPAEDAATADSEIVEDRASTTISEQGDSWRAPDDSSDDSTWPRGEERAEHIADVLDRIQKAGEDGLSAEDLHTVDPDKEIWSIERTLQHDSLLADMYDRAADVPCEHKAIIAGGLSGAGKTTVLANHPEIDRSQYLTINPDDIKEEMAQRNMIPEVEGLSPMEASDLVHEESSYLARQLALRAQADGKNLIWDITMSDLQKTQKRIQDLREAGYSRIDGIFVEISIETSLRRTGERYWADQNKWFSGQGIGGRLIPPDVILRQRDDEWGSCNRKTFETINKTFENWEIQDNSVDDCPAKLIRRGHKEQ
jgi:zeta toxin